MLNKKIIQNIYWLILDKLLVILLQFFVGVKIANYYGPNVYGEYSYAIAIIAFSPILLEIINGRVVKEFYDEKFNNIVSTVTLFRELLTFILFLLVLISYPIFKENKMLYYILLLLLSFDNILLNMTVGIENYFEYKLFSKNIVISNNFIKIISYILQYIGMILGHSILLIPIIRILGSLIRVLILKKFYYKIFKEKVQFRLDKKLIKKIIRNSFYLWLSTISLVIYTQIDKIMIGKILNISDVGVYNIALQLAGVLEILIGPFQNSIYPKLMEMYKKNYSSYIKLYLKINTVFTQIYFLLTLISIAVVKWLFPYVYTKEYSSAILCYGILTISVFFKANGALQTGHMTLKRITKKSFYKTLFGLVLNIILNLTLIPKYGIYGAAIATSITQVFTIFIVDYFIKEYREQFFIQLKSFNPLNMKG